MQQRLRGGEADTQSLGRGHELSLPIKIHNHDVAELLLERVEALLLFLEALAQLLGCRVGWCGEMVVDGVGFAVEGLSEDTALAGKAADIAR